MVRVRPVPPLPAGHALAPEVFRLMEIIAFASQICLRRTCTYSLDELLGFRNS